MALVPNEDEAKEAQFDTALQIEEKRAEQAIEGKRFKVDKDGHAPGVMPESAWKSHKDE